MQGPVADIVIVQCLAIFVREAVAFHRITNANALVACVGHGARVTVVTLDMVEIPGATADAIAKVIRAGVAIVTNDGQTAAHPCFTMVTDGASIVVHALPLTEVFQNTPLFASTGIHGAVVAVIAMFDILAVHQGRLIYLAVTVIIKAVAHLQRGNARIAVSESLLRAHPDARASPRLVAHLAGSMQGLLHRVRSAGADPGLRKTLVQRDPIHRDNVLARKAPGTIRIKLAGSAAKAPLGTVIHAGIISPTEGFAIAADGARFAQT
jgi:hypothetical protein